MSSHTHVCVCVCVCVCVRAVTGEITKCFGSPGEIRSEEGELVGKRAREEFHVGWSRWVNIANWAKLLEMVEEGGEPGWGVSTR